MQREAHLVTQRCAACEGASLPLQHDGHHHRESRVRTLSSLTHTCCLQASWWNRWEGCRMAKMCWCPCSPSSALWGAWLAAASRRPCGSATVCPGTPSHQYAG